MQPVDESEFKNMGEASVEAALDEGLLFNPSPGREWLYRRRLRREIMAVSASWVLVVITFMAIWWQKEDAREQLKYVEALSKIQMSTELNKQFDSADMRKARIILAHQLLNNKEVTEFRVIAFFGKLASYEQQGLISNDLVYKSYAYWIERYWPAIKTSIETSRQQEGIQYYYKDLDGLYGEMMADDAKVGRATPSQSEIHRFLFEEALLPQ
jgi:hypothetical protein